MEEKTCSFCGETIDEDHQHQCKQMIQVKLRRLDQIRALEAARKGLGRLEMWGKEREPDVFPVYMDQLHLIQGEITVVIPEKNPNENIPLESGTCSGCGFEIASNRKYIYCPLCGVPVFLT